MSRRREAADLARALRLSTQEASTAAHLSPHTLPSSSSSRPTQDSRDMELKAILAAPAHVAPTFASSVGGSAQWGMPPSVMTFAQEHQEHVSSSPRAVHPPSVLPDLAGTAVTPSHEHLSTIASFTPTRSPAHGPAVRVPATSEITPSHSNTASPIHRLTPTAGASGSGSGSNGSTIGTTHSNRNPANQQRAPHSSPSTGPLPSSRLSNGNPSHVSSSGSSHRNLFPSLNPSLTQTSAVPISSTGANGQPRKVVITYGKAQAQKEGTAGMLAAVPDVTADSRRRLSPTKRLGPVPVSKPISDAARRRILSPDEPDERAEIEAQEMAEAEEQVEDRTAAVQETAPAPKSAAKTVEVVLPTRTAVKSTHASPEKQIRSPPVLQARGHSPDPLDSNIFRPESSTPSTAAPASSGLSVLSPIKSSNRSVAPSSRGQGKAVTPASTARSARGTTTSSQISESGSASASAAGPVRISKRVQVQREKEEAEKEARREARRIRKEKERLEAEKKEAESRRAPKRARGEVEEESVLLPAPAKRAQGRRGNGSPVKRVIEEVEEEDEVVVVEDETLVPAKTTSAEVQKAGEGTGGTQAGSEREDGVKAAPISPSKATTTPAAGNKKRKRMVLDEDDDQDEHGDDGRPPQPAEMLEPDVAVLVAAPTKKGKKAKATPKSKGKGKAKKAAEVEEVETVAGEVAGGESAATDVKVDEGQVGDAAAEDKGVEPEPAKLPEDEKAPGAQDAEEDDEGVVKSAYFGSKGDKAKAAITSPPKSSNTTSDRGTPRPPLNQSTSSVNAPARASPGPSNAPGGIKWKTQRTDLAGVLSKFGGARQSGMSRRSKIVSLHSKIGPPVKALPPPPPKASKKKKDEEEEDEDSDEAEMESDGEGGVRRKKKERGMEWYMVED